MPYEMKQRLLPGEVYTASKGALISERWELIDTVSDANHPNIPELASIFRRHTLTGVEYFFLYYPASDLPLSKPTKVMAAKGEKEIRLEEIIPAVKTAFLNSDHNQDKIDEGNREQCFKRGTHQFAIIANKPILFGIVGFRAEHYINATVNLDNKPALQIEDSLRQITYPIKKIATLFHKLSHRTWGVVNMPAVTGIKHNVGKQKDNWSCGYRVVDAVARRARGDDDTVTSNLTVLVNQTNEFHARCPSLPEKARAPSPIEEIGDDEFAVHAQPVEKAKQVNKPRASSLADVSSGVLMGVAAGLLIVTILAAVAVSVFVPASAPITVPLILTASKSLLGVIAGGLGIAATGAVATGAVIGVAAGIIGACAFLGGCFGKLHNYLKSKPGKTTKTDQLYAQHARNRADSDASVRQITREPSRVVLQMEDDLDDAPQEVITSQPPRSASPLSDEDRFFDSDEVSPVRASSYPGRFLPAPAPQGEDAKVDNAAVRSPSPALSKD